jgi:hypothetical protein
VWTDFDKDNGAGEARECGRRGYDFVSAQGDALERHTPGMTVPLAVKEPRLTLALAAAAPMPQPPSYMTAS